MFSTCFMVSKNNICLHLKQKNSQLFFVCPNMRHINKHYFWLCCTILLWMKLLFIIVIKRVYANKRTSALLHPSRLHYFENLTTIQFTAVFSFLWTKKNVSNAICGFMLFMAIHLMALYYCVLFILLSDTIYLEIPNEFLTRLGNILRWKNVYIWL